jgi:hypothetical protein
MLTTLGSAPTVLSTRRARPVFSARWITTRPAGRPPTRSRGQRPSRWQPVSILDIGALVPPPEVAPGPHRQLLSPGWMAEASCADMPTETSDPLFFGIEHRESPGLLIAAANTARRICDACPVAAACLTYALENDERYGVWGGQSGRQREKLRRRMSAGTPIDELVSESLPLRELTA